jgi:hypothetical protein
VAIKVNGNRLSTDSASGLKYDWTSQSQSQSQSQSPNPSPDTPERPSQSLVEPSQSPEQMQMLQLQAPSPVMTCTSQSPSPSSVTAATRSFVCSTGAGDDPSSNGSGNSKGDGSDCVLMNVSLTEPLRQSNCDDPIIEGSPPPQPLSQLDPQTQSQSQPSSSYRARSVSVLQPRAPLPGGFLSARISFLRLSEGSSAPAGGTGIKQSYRRVNACILYIHSKCTATDEVLSFFFT